MEYIIAHNTAQGTVKIHIKNGCSSIRQIKKDEESIYQYSDKLGYILKTEQEVQDYKHKINYKNISHCQLCFKDNNLHLDI